MLLIVLVTDESGDDGGYVEEARQALSQHRVPLYVIGRQSLFGYQLRPPPLRRPGDQGRLLARRSAAGPRPPTSRSSSGTASTTAGTSSPRASPPTSWPAWPRTPAGSTSCSPARRTCGSASARRRTRSSTLKEYVPEYDEPRWLRRRRGPKSDLRRTPLPDRRRDAEDFVYRRDFPIDPGELVQAAAQEGGEGHPAGSTSCWRSQKRLERWPEAPRPRARASAGRPTTT